jgi:type IV secretory pathway VirB10-like protein
MRNYIVILAFALALPVMAETVTPAPPNNDQLMEDILDGLTAPELTVIENDARAAAKQSRRIAEFALRDARKLDEIADEAAERREKLEDQQFKDLLESSNLSFWDETKAKARRAAGKFKRWWKEDS